LNCEKHSDGRMTSMNTKVLKIVLEQHKLCLGRIATMTFLSGLLVGLFVGTALGGLLCASVERIMFRGEG